MTHSDDSTTPPVDRIISRRRFLKMGAIVVAVGFAGPTALARGRSLARAGKADAKNQEGKTTRTAERPHKAAPASKTARAAERSKTSAQRDKPLRAETRSARVAERQNRRAQARARRGSERATQVARAERQHPAARRGSRFAHIEHAPNKVENTPVLAQVERAPQVEIDEKPLRNPSVQMDRSSVVTPSTSFTRPAHPVQSDYGSATPRSFARMERSLEMYNAHTGESLKTVYWAFDKYLPSALRDVNWLLRDHHSNDTIAMDPELLDLLYNLSRTLDIRPSFQVISAYRSPATNAMLRMTSSGVAEHSQHMKGKAVDIRIPGSGLAGIRRAALSLQAGGVGYYPWSNFIHLDTGPVRSWLA